MNSKILKNSICGSMLIVFTFWLNFPVPAQLPRLILNEVYVDFAVGTDNPLIKTRFNVYDPVGPTMEQFNQNVKIMNELNIETYRIELGWGRRYSGFGLNTMITGTPEQLTYDFEALDHMVAELKKQNVLLHGAYCYLAACSCITRLQARILICMFISLDSHTVFWRWLHTATC